MNKATTDAKPFRMRRNSSFIRTVRREVSKELLQVPELPVEEVKTVRMATHKKTGIPILKMEGLGGKHKDKLHSLGDEKLKAIAT